MFLVLVMYALFASVFTIAKTGLEFSQPIFFVGSRMFFAGLLLLFYLYCFDRKALNFTVRQLVYISCLAAINIYFTNILELWGLQYLPSYKTCLIYSPSPFLSAFFAFLVFGDKMSARRWIGLIIGLISLIPIFLYHTQQEYLSGHLLHLTWAEVAVLGAVIASAYGWILMQKIVKEQSCSISLANGLSMLIGGSMALTHSACVETWDPIPVTEFFPFVECAFLLLVISNLVCYNLYGYLLKRFSATFMSVAGTITPFFAAFFGWFYLGEEIAWPFYLSASIGMIGLIIFYQDELRREGLLAAKVTG